MVHKIGTGCLSWNFVFHLTQICWMYAFSVVDWKHPFWANLVQKIKAVCLSWNLVPTLIRMFQIRLWCSLFPFWLEIPFLGKFGPKTEKCLFKLKFDIKTNWNVLDSMVTINFLFSAFLQFFWLEIPFWGKIWSNS